MIEPLLINSYPDLNFFAYQKILGNDEIFCLLEMTNYRILYLFDVNKTEPDSYFFKFCSVFYKTNRSRDYFVNARSNTTTRDKFVNCVLSEYPKYAEWMLYHPEWLA